MSPETYSGLLQKIDQKTTHVTHHHDSRFSCLGSTLRGLVS